LGSRVRVGWLVIVYCPTSVGVTRATMLLAPTWCIIRIG
jgi:hypothetical protein